MTDSDDMAAGPQDVDSATPATVRITAKEASQLIRKRAAVMLFALLKQPDFEYARNRVFAGFRVSADSLSTPLARGRLITEAMAEPKLADAIRALPERALRERRAAEPGGTKPASPAGNPSAAGPSKPSASHRREIKEARERIRALESRVKAAERELAAERVTDGELCRQVAALESRGLWRERKIRRVERELAEARRLADKRRDEPAAVPGRPEPSTSTVRAPAHSIGRTDFRPGVEALDRLVSRGKFDAVDLVLEEMLHADGEDVAARGVRARLRAAQGRDDQALEDLRFIFDQALRAGDMAGAAQTLAMSRLVAQTPDKSMATALFAAVSKRMDQVDAVAHAFSDINGTSAYRTLAAWCLAPLKRVLFPAAGVSGRDGLPAEMLRAVGDESLTVQQVVRAIDRGDRVLVELARRAIADMDKRGRDDAQSAFDRASHGSYYRLLARRTLAGPAIVDASNVACFDMTMMAADKPLLANILAVRDALRESGYFPVEMIADANLSYRIDQPNELRSMIDRGEVATAISGTQADEVIVRDARRLSAVIVSNDYMVDWEPDRELDKMQYSISPVDGRAELYP